MQGASSGSAQSDDVAVVVTEGVSMCRPGLGPVSVVTIGDPASSITVIISLQFHTALVVRA